MKHQGYLTRALKSSDRRYARIFAKLGYDTTALTASDGPVLPDNWRDLSAAELKALALEIAGEKVTTKADAIAAIELALESRG